MYRNRGWFPPNPMPDNQNNGEYNHHGGFRPPHYRHYRNWNFFIIYYDRKFVAIELIAILIIILTAVAVYLFAYQTSFEDPLATVKSNLLTAQLIMLGVTIVATALVTFLTKSSKENLIINLKIVATLSILVVLILFGVKIHIDSQYNNESIFEEFYEQRKEDIGDLNKLNISSSGMKILDAKEAYIQESKSAYTNFTVKTYFYIVINILLIILIFYLAHRLSVIEQKKDEVTKNDEVLFDEEENVKM